MLLPAMCASLKHALGAFEPSRLEVRWQSRATNIVENALVIVREPRDVRGLHASESFFRLQAPPASRHGWQLTGSLVCHAFLLFTVLAISRETPPTPTAPLLPPEVQITWYGPAKDVAPKIAPLPKRPQPKTQTRPARPRQRMVTRGYNPNTMVVFQPPHATNRRQLLIETQSPPQLPKSLPAMPNVIQWGTTGPASPAIAIQANQLRALRGKESEQAHLRAPRITYQTPQGRMDMLPNPNSTVAPPSSLPPTAIHGVRAGSNSKSAAAAPMLGSVAPAGRARLAFTEGTDVAPGPPLPGTLGAIRATREGSNSKSAAAPTLGRVAPAGGARLAFAEGTDVAPGPPLPGALGAIRATRAASPHVAAQGSPSVGTSSLGASTIYLPANSGVPFPPLPSAPNAIRAQSSKGSGSSMAAPSVGLGAGRLVSLSLSPGTAPPPPGNAYAPMSIGPHPGRKGRPAASDLAGSGEYGEAPGFPAPEGSVTGPKGLLILHNGNSPAPPPVPQPVAPALPKSARVAPNRVAADIPRRLVRAKRAVNPESGHGRSNFVPRPISVADNVLLVGVVRQDLANRTIGPWSMPTLALNLPKLSNSRGTWVLDFADPMPLALREQNNVIVPLPNRAAEPQYPAALQQKGVRGKVVLRAVIGTKGRVSQIRVTQSLNPVLDHMAEVAFSHWRFDPALLNNKPIAVPVIVTVPFHYVPALH